MDLLPAPGVLIVLLPRFASGLSVGLGGLAVLILYGLARRRPGAEPPGIGVALAALLIVSTFLAAAPPLSLPVGVALLALAGARVQPSPVDRLFWSLPGALVLVSGVPVSLTARGLLLAGVLLFGASLAAADERYRGRPAVPLRLTITLVGIMLVVPDTELAARMLGVLAPTMLLLWPLRLGALGRSGSFALAGAMLWLTGFEARGRESAIVGGLVCLGAFLFEALVPPAPPRGATAGEEEGSTRALGAHLLIVPLGSRVVGMVSSLGLALALAVPVILGGGAIFGLASRRRSSRDRDSSAPESG